MINIEIITMKYFIFSLIVIIVSSYEASAQNVHQSISAAGGNASGSAGEISYSVGQVFYLVKESNNITVSEGVQQPYEISVITSYSDDAIGLDYKVFPNPANDAITLRVPEKYCGKSVYKLYDAAGKVLSNATVNKQEVIIETGQLSKGIYFLNISDEKKQLKNFKIIKN